MMIDFPFPYKYVFFDVDGTLVTTKSGDTYRRTAKDWVWLPNRREKCQQLRNLGVTLCLVTNQAGVAFEWSRFTENEIREEIYVVARGIGADPINVKVCYTTPNNKALAHYYNPNDQRRKPYAGMLNEIIISTDLPRKDFLLVGVREEDMQAAKSANIDFTKADKFFSLK